MFCSDFVSENTFILLILLQIKRKGLTFVGRIWCNITPDQVNLQWEREEKT